MKKEDVDKMTLQEAVDYSVDMLLKQGEPCRDGEKCLYGDGLGNHCSIGWLLDDKNDTLMDDVGAVNGLYDSDNVPELIKDNIDAFSSLQLLHDCDNMDNWDGRMERLLQYIDISTDRYEQWRSLWIEHQLKEIPNAYI